MDIAIKRDPQPNFGTLKVTIGYTNDLTYLQGFEEILDEAIAHWESLYSAYGITLDIEITPTSISGNIPSPYDGDASYYTLNALGDDSDILVLLGENIEGYTDIFGMAGSVPGTTMRHTIGAIAVSWLYGAGPDGVFDSIDIRLLGETLAHEVGHYLGLPHVVEQSWAHYDALGDTIECTSLEGCEGSFSTNIMFPYPVCTTQDCIVQDQFSTEQKGVLHLYTGVD